jgi:hypothetical protein
MERPVLFLLKPGFFADGRGPLYCPACATLEGLFVYEPSLREHVDVRYVDFPRPRVEVVAMLGEGQQGLPVLVMPASIDDEKVRGLDLRTAKERRFLRGPADIGTFLSRLRGTPAPH